MKLKYTVDINSNCLDLFTHTIFTPGKISYVQMFLSDAITRNKRVAPTEFILLR